MSLGEAALMPRMSSREAQEADLQEVLEDALAGPERSVRRIAKAGTSVRFVITGRPDCGGTLLCDRVPPQTMSEGASAEITIELTEAQATAFSSGQLNLPALLLEGEVGYHGPVRKFLAVEPILRSLLRRSSAQ